MMNKKIRITITRSHIYQIRIELSNNSVYEMDTNYYFEIRKYLEPYVDQHMSDEILNEIDANIGRILSWKERMLDLI